MYDEHGFQDELKDVSVRAICRKIVVCFEFILGKFSNVLFSGDFNAFICTVHVHTYTPVRIS